MEDVIVTKKDDLIMRLSHYFITEENYTPIVVNGVKDEIWLENDKGPYRIIRIHSHYIHNEEQFNFDKYKLSNVMKQIKRKTLSFKMNALNIYLDVNDSVVLSDEKNISNVVIKDIKDVKKKKILTEVFPSIKDNLLEDKKGVDLIINVSTDINKKNERENKHYENVFKPKKPLVTNTLIVCNVLVFILMYIFGNGSLDNVTLFRFGANYSEAVVNGEYYRLITAIFLHGGLLHLFVNMYSLKIIGSQLESYLGKWRFLLVYLLSGICGNLLSCIFNTSLSVGASGAIFGLLGAFIYFGYHYRLFLNSTLKTQLIPIVAINLLIGFITPGIDNAAHIGGLIGGYIFTKALGIKEKTTLSDQINGVIVSILLFAILIFFLFK